MEWYLYPAIIAGWALLPDLLIPWPEAARLLTLPLLMFLGLPANVANGTNRVAIFLQNIVAVGSFKKQKIFHYSEGIWLAIPATVGAFLGSLIAVQF